MRMVIRARLNSEAYNQASAGKPMADTIKAIIEQLQPEAAYFTPTEGDRCCYIVFDMQDSSEMPKVAEPFFLMGAKVSIQPVMNLEDLLRGLATLD
ncbi:DUF3303 family protein [Embleya sp. NBC_00896]|uniref:DUF3303 family protein n=1 Tax=Embleya sp. NBC_00896 TaxID=2975961 RepID=UPI002F919A48|nr:hypothetical protein OG928_40845 [Embleya sp. NBC_00896]